MAERILEFRTPGESWHEVNFGDDGIARRFPSPDLELRYRPGFVPGWFRSVGEGRPIISWFDRPVDSQFRDDWIRVDVIDANPKPGDYAG